jgi:hypothetical protein
MKTRFEEVLEAAAQDRVRRLAQRAEEIARKPKYLPEVTRRCTKHRKPHRIEWPGPPLFATTNSPDHEPALRPNLSIAALDLLKQMCHTGIITDLLGISREVEELVARKYLVRGVGVSYIITRAGRVAGSGQDAPVIKARKKRRL